MKNGIMRKTRVACACGVLGMMPFMPVSATSIDFGKIGSTEAGFQQYWGLSAEEAKAYHNYMEIAGKYRHKDVDPLLVLSMIADTQEDKLYYAKKAAEHEHDMVKREIEAAWMLSDAMSEEKLATNMANFTNKLTGLNTAPTSAAQTGTVAWEEGDTFLVYVDDRCQTAECLEQFIPVLKALPANISHQYLVIKGKLSDVKALDALASTSAQLAIRALDPIEHSYLTDSFANRALHVRDGHILRVMPTGSAAGTASGAAQKSTDSSKATNTNTSNGASS